MTRRPVMIVGLAVAVLIAGLLLWRSVDAAFGFLSRRGDLIQRIESAQAAIEKSQRRVAGKPALERELQSYADRTLGSDREEVDAHLRRRLNRIAESVGIGSATVGTGSVSAKQSPARRAFPRSASWKSLREEDDFTELGGWISGEGTLDQAVCVVDRIEAEPWLKRIDQIKLDPKDNGQRFGFTVRLTTLFLPGLGPSESEPTPYDHGRLERLASLVEKNPFRVPPPSEAPPPAAVVEQAPPAGPTGFPYGQWIVTGVARNQSGEEVWLRNTTTGESRRLIAGETIGEAIFTAAKGDSAVFSLEDHLFLVTAGRNLADRLAVNP